MRGNERKCRHCDSVIKTNEPPLTSDWWTAWLAGYCSPICSHEASRLTVTQGGAWWQRVPYYDTQTMADTVVETLSAEPKEHCPRRLMGEQWGRHYCDMGDHSRDREPPKRWNPNCAAHGDGPCTHGWTHAYLGYHCLCSCGCCRL